jgi:hypothetical protein
MGEFFILAIGFALMAAIAFGIVYCIFVVAYRIVLQAEAKILNQPIKE